ncbi:unnamed protein product [Prorocentrum cordatum]|uniref:Uncharacterized protein n=1 Tax=Prorocentrum cordatum TaxID=2364126 RepID=A0ABN9SYZ5_9DINO|nr:unnamed protein product [Polarella glacialis]
MLRRQLAVDVRQESGGTSPDPAALGPTEGQDAHRVAVGRCLQEQRWKQVRRIDQTPRQRREVALTEIIPAAGHGAAVAPDQGRVAATSRNLRLGQAPRHRWEVALTVRDSSRKPQRCRRS